MSYEFKSVEDDHLMCHAIRFVVEDYSEGQLSAETAVETIRYFTEVYSRKVDVEER